MASSPKPPQTPPREILIEGLVKGLGYSRAAAASFVDHYTAQVVMITVAATPGEQES
jgi:hypothetical protein